MPENKKILYIITQSEWGGSQKYVFDLATALSSRGISPRRDDEGSRSFDNGIATSRCNVGTRNDAFFNFEIIVAAGEDKNGELFAHLKEKNIRTIYLKNLVRKISLWTDFLGLWEIIKLIKKERPDIVHLNSTKVSVLGSLATFIAKLKISNRKLKIIYTVHGWVFNEPLSRWQKTFYFWAEKITSLFKDKIICVSEFDRQVALKYGFKTEKLITIHNGINIKADTFWPKEKALKLLNLPPHPGSPFFKTNDKFFRKTPPFMAGRGGLPLEMNGIATPRRNVGDRNDIRKTKIIGTIANFYPTKGLNYLIATADLVRKKFPNVIFVLIGDGLEKEKLEKKIDNLSLKKNFQLIKIETAYKYLKAFDAFVLPSVKEGLPYTILEAMAAELPIVATRVGGIPEIIEDGVSGFLVEPKDNKTLAKKISQLLENPELAQKLAKNAKEKFDKKFGFKKMIQKTSQIYLES